MIDTETVSPALNRFTLKQSKIIEKLKNYFSKDHFEKEEAVNKIAEYQSRSDSQRTRLNKKTAQEFCDRLILAKIIAPIDLTDQTDETKRFAMSNVPYQLISPAKAIRQNKRYSIKI